MESYRASSGFREDGSTIFFPFNMPLVREDIMFSMEVFILGGAVMDGKTHISEESFNNPTPTY